MSLIGLLLAAAFLWILQCSLCKHWWQKGLDASVSFCEKYVFEGDVASLDETITNAKFLPIPALHVKFQMGRALIFSHQENSTVTDQNYRSDIFSCMPWQQIHRHLEFTCNRRGYYPIQQLDLSSYDLLWSSQFYSTRQTDTALYVYPAYVDVKRLQLPLLQLTGSMAAQNALLRDPFDLQSIRNYMPEDPYRDINWKATARTGTLKSNVHTPSASWQVCILLDGDSDRLWADNGLKEEAVRLCATLADALIARQIPVSVRSNACDCLTQKELEIAPGAGKNHLQAILQLLSRAELEERTIAVTSHASKRRSMEHLITDLVNIHNLRLGQHTVTYILISPCQRDILAQSYALLCRLAPGSQWILPMRPDENVRLSDLPKELENFFYPWETGGHENFS